MLSWLPAHSVAPSPTWQQPLVSLPACLHALWNSQFPSSFCPLTLVTGSLQQAARWWTHDPPLTMVTRTAGIATKQSGHRTSLFVTSHSNGNSNLNCHCNLRTCVCVCTYGHVYLFANLLLICQTKVK